MYLNKYAPIVQGATTELDCSSTNTFDWSFISTPMKITRLICGVSTVMSSTGGIVVTFTARPTYGSATNAVTLGTVTIGSTAAVGKIYYNDITPVAIPVGYQIHAAVTTAATTSGKCFPLFEASENPEVPANNANMISVTA